MKISFLAFLLICSTAHAQFWEPTGGPGGSGLWEAMICPNADIYVLSEGIYRSQDNGVTWKHVGREIPFSGNARRILHTPSGTICVLTNGQLWRSQDHGDSWTKLDTFEQTAYLAIAPSGQVTISSHDSLYHSLDEGTTWYSKRPLPDSLGDYISIDHDGVIYTVSPFYNYFRSLDNGATWVEMPEGLPHRGPNWFKSITSNVVFAGIGNDLYSSTDSGRVWKNMLFPGGSPVRSFLPMNEDTILVSHDNGLLRTTDGGTSWEPFAEGYPSSASRITGKEDNLFLLTYYDLYNYQGVSVGWKKISVPTGQVLLLAATNSGEVVAASKVSAGSLGIRVWSRSADGEWQECSVIESYGIKSLAADSTGMIFMATNDGYLRYSSDPLTTWETAGFRVSGTQMGFSKYLHFLVSRGKGIFRSSDKGSTWDTINVGITDLGLTAVATAEPGLVYAGGTMTFYRSSDFGSTWEEPLFPFIGGSGKVSAIVARDSNVIVAVDRTGVYFSSDYGSLWENHSQGLVSGLVFSLVNTPSGALFLATSTGFYEYQYLTKTWLKVDENIKILSLALGDDGRLYAGTDGDGVWRTTKTYGSWTRDVSRHEVAEQRVNIFPNPASMKIKVGFDPTPQNYTVTIFDLLGQRIVTTKGTDIIDVSTLRSGQYFARIVSPEHVVTLPLVISR